MAVWTASYGYARIRVTATESGVNIANNTSVVTVKTEVYYDGGTSTRNGFPQTLTVKIDGTTYTPTTSFTYGTLYPGNSVHVATQSRTVTHNADGSKTAAIYVHMTDKKGDNATVSNSLGLTTIARKSTFSLSTSSQSLGGSVTVNISRASSSFTHKVYYRYGSASWTQIGGDVATSAVWWLPASLANNIPTATSGTVSIAVDTYNGGTMLGSNSTTMTFTIPDNSTYNPSASIGSITEGGTHAGLSSISAFVQGYSRLNIAKSGAAKYGASVTEYRITFDGTNYYGSGTTTTGTTNTAGTRTIYLRVTDSRGRTATADTTVSILGYTPPKINTFNVKRSPNDQSTGLSAAVNFTMTALNNQNAKSYSVKYGTTSATTTMVSGNVYTMNETHVKNGVLSTDLSYVVTLTISDSFGSASITRPISSIFQLINFNASGRGMAIGQVSTKNAFQVNMDIETTGGIESEGPVVGDGLYISRANNVDGKNMNDIRKTGVYRGYNMSNAAIAGISTFQVIAYSDDWITQTQYYMGGNSIVQYNRAWVQANRWTPWIEATPQPADFVVSRGINWVRWNSGRLEMWNRVIISQPVANRFPSFDISFPISFVNYEWNGSPVLASTLNGSPGAVYNYSRRADGVSGNVTRFNSTETSGSFTIDYYVTGRWK